VRVLQTAREHALICTAIGACRALFPSPSGVIFWLDSLPGLSTLNDCNNGCYTTQQCANCTNRRPYQKYIRTR
jgi:hypothetical protein